MRLYSRGREAARLRIAVGHPYTRTSNRYILNVPPAMPNCECIPHKTEKLNASRTSLMEAGAG
jgi:hypothetical protein